MMDDLIEREALLVLGEEIQQVVLVAKLFGHGATLPTTPCTWGSRL
jgi:hypothetical protein